MNLVEIGYFSKTSGIKGELILKSDVAFFFEEVNALFVGQGGDKAPYFVKKIREGGKDLVVTLEDVDEINKAKALVGKKVFADEKFLAEDDDHAANLEGFELIDHRLGSLGKIAEVKDTGHQLLVTIHYKEKEVILPLAQELIREIDDKNKKIYYEAPEGLIDLYLED